MVYDRYNNLPLEAAYLILGGLSPQDNGLVKQAIITGDRLFTDFGPYSFYMSRSSGEIRSTWSKGDGTFPSISLTVMTTTYTGTTSSYGNISFVDVLPIDSVFILSIVVANETSDNDYCCSAMPTRSSNNWSGGRWGAHIIKEDGTPLANKSVKLNIAYITGISYN